MRLIIVSNRLPVTLQHGIAGLPFKRSIGGLATGIESYVQKVEEGETCFQDHLWVGWPGMAIGREEKNSLHAYWKANKFCPVYLEEDLIQQYYSGFCNRTIWPLFHYFPNYVKHEEASWPYYQQANEVFYETLRNEIREGDVVWIHDYHLMLLPGLIRKDFPDLAISFFLHIPFPAHNMLRHLSSPEYTSMLEGMLGADVVGFHTQEYAQEFLNSTSRALKLPNDHQVLSINGRKVRVGVFPMGIDYAGIQDVSLSADCQLAMKKIRQECAGRKLVISIDRLDYTKGILNRLIAFDKLLKKYPEWRGKVVLMLLVAPSRREIESYQEIKQGIDSLVGNINGSYGTNSWVPVIYQYRQLDLAELCALYSASDVCLVTPLKDGMNLIAKEFIASHTDRKGVLILSEMAGAVHELTDAIAVNPYSTDEIVNAFIRALNMKEEEQVLSNQRMHERIKDYDVLKWAEEIIEATRGARFSNESFNPGARVLEILTRTA
jgi:trehalose 6-phosphate synthase/phosphatase